MQEKNNLENQELLQNDTLAAEKKEAFENMRNRILSGIDDENNGDEHQDDPKNPIKTIIYVCTIVVISILLAGTILLTVAEIMGIGGSEDIVQVEIPKGSSTQAIARILKEKKIIRSTYLFRFVAKNEESAFNYGFFTLSDNMSYSQIFKVLEEVSPITGEINFTIIEGDNLQTIAKKLEKNDLCTAKGFMNVVNEVAFGYSFEEEMGDNPLIFYRSEGYLFPDTYQLYNGMTAEEIIKVFYGNFSSKITTELRDRMLELNMSLADTITLASIIQAEAPDKASMKKVSGVFHNRLNHTAEYPRLESDPTKKYVANVIKPNLEKPNKPMTTAYDTYQGTGLTPGPICNPGMDAIEAALYPDTTGDYYYFCANVNTKDIYFAKTLAQHNANLYKAGLK